MFLTWFVGAKPNVSDSVVLGPSVDPRPGSFPKLMEAGPTGLSRFLAFSEYIERAECALDGTGGAFDCRLAPAVGLSGLFEFESLASLSSDQDRSLIAAGLLGRLRKLASSMNDDLVVRQLRPAKSKRLHMGTA